MKIEFCGKQIKENGCKTCGVTEITDCSSIGEEENFPTSIFICKECLKSFRKLLEGEKIR